MKQFIIAAAVLVWIGATVGCGKKDADNAQAAPAAALPDGLVLNAAPENAVSVIDAKSTATDGQRIVIEGRVGGTKRAVIDGRALFTIADRQLLACDAMGDGDHCPTPWDYCCEDPDKLKTGLATVKIAGSDGKPLAVDLATAIGLQPLQTVIVTGIVEPRADDGALIIRADGVFISGVKTPAPARAAPTCCPH